MIRRTTYMASVWIAALSIIASSLLGGIHPVSAAEATIRVLAIDGNDGDVTILDGTNGEIVGQFTTGATGFAPVYASEDGRHFIVNHYEGEHVTLIDSGLHTEPHGDHVDLVVETPFVRATLPLGSGASHAWTHDGRVILVHDVDGSVAVFDADQLATDLTPTTFTIEPEEHAAIATLGDSLLVGYYGFGRIDVWSLLDGTLEQENLAPCTGAHGEAQVGDTIYFGCGEGVTGVTLDASGELVTETIPYPDAPTATDTATPEVAESPRASTLAAHEESPVFVGNYGDGLAIIDPDTEAMDLVDLPSAPLAFQFSDTGDQVIVLTDDGNVHGIDPVAGDVSWSTASVTPYSELQSGDEEFHLYPSITIAESFAYIPDPGAGDIVVIDTSSRDIIDRYDVGGQPARVVAVVASGIEH